MMCLGKRFMKKIRNFAIIAHIDAGKSTLADRFLELTGTIPKRKMREQFLDKMELEREKGITIKLQPIRMEYEGYILNMIDTPGHVDFSYEVSRSLAAVEGAILLVDGRKGIQAQTIAHLDEAKKQNLVIIPVINKIDLSGVNVPKLKKEITTLLDCSQGDILEISAKEGTNVEKLLERVVDLIPVLKGDISKSPRALIFDSYFDQYKGVIAYVRLVDGEIKKGDGIYLIQGEISGEALEIGHLKEEMIKKEKLLSGEIGYITTNLRELEKARVGDTITLSKEKNKVKSLPGYSEVKHFVYADFYTEDGNDYPKLQDALSKLALNDASLEYSLVKGKMIGQGFRCGFLGLLHLEIVKERLKREFELDLVITSPNVNLKIKCGESFVDLKDVFDYDNQGEIKEPYILLKVISPTEYIGPVMELLKNRRSKYINNEYLGEDVSILNYELPLSEVIIDFYDKLKSVSSGFASMSYEQIGYREADLVRLDVKVADDLVEPFSQIVPSERKEKEAREMAKKLQKLIPKQQFQVAIQVCEGGRIIARENIRALKKDVTAKLYGGDRTRKDKLLKKQAKGKKRLKKFGKVDIPSDVFFDVLKR